MRKPNVGNSYLWDRFCSIFSEAGKFCHAHWLRQLTRDTLCDVSCLHTLLTGRNQISPNDGRSWPSYHVNCKSVYPRVGIFGLHRRPMIDSIKYYLSPILKLQQVKQFSIDRRCAGFRGMHSLNEP